MNRVRLSARSEADLQLGERRDDLRPGLRSSTVGSYVVFYFPLADGVEVVAIIHGARDVESLFRRGEI